MGLEGSGWTTAERSRKCRSRQLECGQKGSARRYLGALVARVGTGLRFGKAESALGARSHGKAVPDEGQYASAQCGRKWSKAMTDLNTMSQAELIALVGRMKADAQRKLTLKVSEKGAVAMYGLGRFPVTLYRGQWERVIEAAKSGAVERFIADNASLLSVKE